MMTRRSWFLTLQGSRGPPFPLTVPASSPCPLPPRWRKSFHPTGTICICFFYVLILQLLGHFCLVILVKKILIVSSFYYFMLAIILFFLLSASGTSSSSSPSLPTYPSIFQSPKEPQWVSDRTTFVLHIVQFVLVGHAMHNFLCFSFLQACMRGKMPFPA